MLNMFWASRPDAAYPSPCQTTIDVLQIEGSPLSWTFDYFHKGTLCPGH